MPPKGQKARRGGKSPGLPKKQPKKVDEKSAAKEPPSELDESLRPEGVGSDVDYVIIYNMETEKFQYYPSRGYAGESLLSSSGIDVSQSLTKDDRMKEFKVKIAPTVSYKSRIFLRFEKGNEIEMHKASVALLNSEMESYDTAAEKLERYEDLLELYKEFVKNGFMIRRRRNTRQMFPDNPRTKRGKEIMFASDICTFGSSKLLVRSPNPSETSSRSILSASHQRRVELEKAQSVTASSLAAAASKTKTTSTADTSKAGASSTTTPATSRPVEETPAPQRKTPRANAGKRKSRDDEEETQTPAKKTKARRSKSEIEKEKEEKAKLAEEKKRKKEEADKAKAEAKLKKLEISAKKASAKAERDMIRKKANEIISEMQEKQRDDAREKYKSLLETESGSQRASQPRGEPQSEDEIDTQGSTDSARESRSETEQDPETQNVEEEVEDEPEIVPDVEQEVEQEASDVDILDLDSRGRRKSPAGVRAKEPKKPDPSSPEKTRRQRIEEINEAIRRREADNPQVDDLLEDLPSENDEDESEEARSNVTGGDGNTTSFRDQLERELAVDTEGRSSAFVNQLCVMNDRLTALEEQGRNNLKALKNTLENDVAANVRSLVGMVSAMAAKQEKADSDAQFDASLAKNRLSKLLPIRQVGEPVDYLFTQPEILKALVEILRQEFQEKLGKFWTVSTMGTEFIPLILARELAAHVYWHDSHDKAESGQGWDTIPVQQPIRDFFEVYIKPMANRDETRDKSSGTKDSKSYKLQGMRKKYFRSIANKNVPNDRVPNNYDWAKNRYDNKKEFFMKVKKKLYPDCGEPPSFASELDDHLKQHNCKRSNKDNLKTMDNLHTFGVPGGLLSDYNANGGETITKEEVDDIIAVLRSCGYGAPTSNKDAEKAKKAAAAMTAKLGTVSLSRRSLRAQAEEGSEQDSNVDDDDDDYVVRPSGITKPKDTAYRRSRSAAPKTGDKSKADTSQKPAAKQKKTPGRGAKDAAGLDLFNPIPGGSKDTPLWDDMADDLIIDYDGASDNEIETQNGTNTKDKDDDMDTVPEDDDDPELIKATQDASNK